MAIKPNIYLRPRNSVVNESCTVTTKREQEVIGCHHLLWLSEPYNHWKERTQKVVDRGGGIAVIGAIVLNCFSVMTGSVATKIHNDFSVIS